ncbi:MAG TPA: ABC transporter ATP-binding protein [Solirubrobacter sp.]|nr:ABC transporter ATP-binding protein [Solirubrobacter sp.]
MLLRPAEYHTRLVRPAPAVAALEIARRFWPYARPYGRWIAFGLVLLCLVPAIDTLEIYLFKLVVDDVLVPRELEALLPIAAAYLGLALAGALVSFGDEYVATWVGERFLLDLRTDVFAHLHSLSPDQLAQRRVGDLLARLTGDVQAIERFVLSALSEGVSAAARVLLFTGALFVLSWKLALAALLVTPLFYFASRRFARLVKHAAREKRRRSGSLGAVAEESLNAAPLVQTLNRQRAEVERFTRDGAAIMDAELAATRIAALFGPLVGVIELLGGMLVIGFGVWAMTSGELSLGGLMVFLTYLARLYSPLRSLGRLSNDVFAAAAGAERVIELLDERPTVADARHARPLPRPVRGHVELRDVSYRYPSASRPALSDISLTVRPGEMVALIGASGAGKSTLARLLVRFADPQAGAVRIDGHDLRDLTLASVREHVGLLLQDTYLPEMSVREAIAQGRAGASAADVEAAARAGGIHDVIAALPDGYDSSATRLSGGQRRRLAIARAFVRDTPVLILDEPTTALDRAARDRLLEPLRALTRHRTTIVITHDPAVIAWADRAIELREGRLAAAPEASVR